MQYFTNLLWEKQYSSFTFKLRLDSKFSGEDRITLGYNSGNCHIGDHVTIITWSVQQSIATCCHFMGWTSHEVVDLSFILNEKYVSLYMKRTSDRVRCSNLERHTGTETNWGNSSRKHMCHVSTCCNLLMAKTSRIICPT